MTRHSPALYVGQSLTLQDRLSGDSTAGWGIHRIWNEVLTATEKGWSSGAGVLIWALPHDRKWLTAVEVALKQRLDPWSDGERCRASSPYRWRYRPPDHILSLTEAWNASWGPTTLLPGCYAWVANDFQDFYSARYR